MTDTNFIRDIRERLMFRDPSCWYCGTGLRYWDNVGGVELPPNFATIEHLHSNLTSERCPSVRGGNNLVLACYDCNQLRGYWDAKILSQPEKEYTDWLRLYLGLRPKRVRRPFNGPPAMQRLYEWASVPSSPESVPCWQSEALPPCEPSRVPGDS